MPDDALDIFGETALVEGWRPRPAWLVSVTIHILLIVALLHGRSPVFVAPSSVLGGANGFAITHLYWATGTDAESKTSGKSSTVHTASRGLTWHKSQKADRPLNHDTPSAEVGRDDAIASAATNPTPPAGSAYGSLTDGSSVGHEIRAALPAVTVEPLITADDLRGGVEGNIVVEITIDEAGNIVNKVVVQSLGAVIDGKVLAALENWRFRPATRDGVPIPSRQDVVYHFKPR